jgi:flagellar biosynthetic protein FliR
MTAGLPLSSVFSFLLVLARVSGLIVFLPVPGFRAAPTTVRALLAVAVSIALFPDWPVLPTPAPSLSQLAAWAFLEAGFGLTAGLAVGFLTEGFQVAAQIIGLQAGYGYSLTVDPTSEADSGVLQVIMSLASGLLFFTLGLDRDLLRALAASLDKFPAGAWHTSAASVDGIVRLGAGMMMAGLRLALPVVATLLLIDVSLALLGRMQQQLQLLSLAFPVKMLAALALLAALSPAFPRSFSSSAEPMLSTLWRGLLP